MKKYIILSLIIGCIVGCLVTTYTIKIVNVEKGLVTVETISGQQFDYYWESEE